MISHLHEVAASRFAWLWNCEQFSDCTLYALEDANQENCNASGQSRALKAYRLHSIVLASGSEYFKTCLCQGLASEGQGPIQYVGKGNTMELCIHQTEIRALDAVLEYIYTNRLATLEDSIDYLRMLKISDQLQADTCSVAIEKAFSELFAKMKSDEKVQMLQFFHTLPSGLLLHAPFVAVGAYVKSFSDDHFQNVFLSKLFQTPLTEQVCLLPVAALRDLLAASTTKVESENEVLLILHEWAVRQPSLPQSTKLALRSLVRVSRLSKAFLLGVLPFLPWFDFTSTEMLDMLAFENLSKDAQSQYTEIAELEPTREVAISRRIALQSPVFGPLFPETLICPREWYNKSRASIEGQVTEPLQVVLTMDSKVLAHLDRLSSSGMGNFEYKKVAGVSSSIACADGWLFKADLWVDQDAKLYVTLRACLALSNTASLVIKPVALEVHELTMRCLGTKIYEAPKVVLYSHQHWVLSAKPLGNVTFKPSFLLHADLSFKFLRS